jgi:hypothetical protein
MKNMMLMMRGVFRKAVLLQPAAVVLAVQLEGKIFSKESSVDDNPHYSRQNGMHTNNNH